MKKIYKVGIGYWDVPPLEDRFVLASSRSDVLRWAEEQVSSLDKEIGHYHISADIATEYDLFWIDPENVPEI